jgi:FlaA1/EpsC-like NDP-sugar epimerase
MASVYTHPALIADILGRSRSLFAEAMEQAHERIAVAVSGQKIMVVGASGSIGSAFVAQLARFRPGALHLVDLSENTLVELVRDLRSSDIELPADFETFSIDYGSAEFRRLCDDVGPYDLFFNFAAMKHVRSERNVYSLLRMIDTNVLALNRFLNSPAAVGLKRAFSVSTDKVVRPANLMGATKNLMEKCLFAASGKLDVSSARFANVVFSDGSLLHGFGLRLAKRQPLALPGEISRYFMSQEEAGELCLLAATVGRNRDVFFPKMEASSDAKSFIEIAEIFLAHHGMKPLPCASEEEAKTRMGENPAVWPCVYSETNTTGEKPLEEFFRLDDTPDFQCYPNIGIVNEPAAEQGLIENFETRISALRGQDAWSKASIVEIIQQAVPELDHLELNRSLDSKM